MKFACLMAGASLVLGAQTVPVPVNTPGTVSAEPVIIKTPEELVKTYLMEKVQQVAANGKVQEKEQVITSVTDLNYQMVLQAKDFLDQSDVKFQEEADKYFKDQKIDFNALVEAARQTKDRLEPPVVQEPQPVPETVPAPEAQIPSVEVPKEEEAAAAQAPVKAEAETEAKAETPAKIETEAKFETKTETAAKAEAETKAETKTEPETEAEVQTETTTEAVPASTAQPSEPAAQSEVIAKAEPKAETAAQPQTTTDSTRVTEFVNRFLTGGSGQLYSAATSQNCRQILGSLSEWNKLDSASKAQINAKLAAAGTSYNRLVAQAQKLATGTQAGVHTAAACDPGFFVGLGTGSLSVLAGLFRSGRWKKAK